MASPSNPWTDAMNGPAGTPSRRKRPSLSVEADRRWKTGADCSRPWGVRELLVRALLGPTVYDRVLAVNTFGTKTVLLIAALGFLTDRPEFLDLALVYALINFIGTIAVLKFFEYGDLGLTRRLEREAE